MVSFGIILDHFGPKAPRLPNCQFWYHFGSFRAQGRPDGPNVIIWAPFRTQRRPDAPNEQFGYHSGPFWAQGCPDVPIEQFW